MEITAAIKETKQIRWVQEMLLWLHSKCYDVTSFRIKSFKSVTYPEKLRDKKMFKVGKGILGMTLKLENKLIEQFNLLKQIGMFKTPSLTSQRIKGSLQVSHISFQNCFTL